MWLITQFYDQNSCYCCQNSSANVRLPSEEWNIGKYYYYFQIILNKSYVINCYSHVKPVLSLCLYGAFKTTSAVTAWTTHAWPGFFWVKIWRVSHSATQGHPAKPHPELTILRSSSEITARWQRDFTAFCMDVIARMWLFRNKRGLQESLRVSPGRSKRPELWNYVVNMKNILENTVA